MNRRQVSALLILQELGIKYQMETFSDRLSVQKAIYLVQAAGTDLGHYYNWYLRGPYSPSLSQDVFGAIQNYDVPAALKEWDLDSATKARLGKLRSCLQSPPQLELSSWLELLASIHFLVERRQVEAVDEDALTEKLLKYGKRFTRDQVVEALSRLRTAKLISA